MKTTIDRVRALQVEAGAAGDLEQVALCERALASDAQALEACARVLVDEVPMLPDEARHVLFWAGVTEAEIRADLASLRSGEIDAAGLLTSCLRGVEDEDTARGWRAYVQALERA